MDRSELNAPGPNRSGGKAIAASHACLSAAADLRTGICLPVQRATAADWDVPGMVHMSVPAEPCHEWQGVSGAVAWGDSTQALEAAIAEALERYAAARVFLPLKPRASIPASECWTESQFALFSDEQRRSDRFPWPMIEHDADLFCAMHRLHDNRRVWVPQELVGLGVREGRARMPSTSSGLAAQKDSRGRAPWRALLRATQEVLERDALAVTWLNGLGGQTLAWPEPLKRQLEQMGAQAQAFDLTQSWNPHPVVAVMGRQDAEGQARYAFGIACRASMEEAMDKAWLEWAQSLRFADHLHRHATVPRDPSELRRFDEHAAYYTCHPEGWRELPLLRYQSAISQGSTMRKPRVSAHGLSGSDEQDLHDLVMSLQGHGIDLAYREITTRDVLHAGLRVVRVLSPQLSLLHADERAPFLGGRTGDWAWRYPNTVAHHPLSNPWPHPLG